MHVLMLNPPFLGRFSRGQRSPAITKSGTLYYPMWLSYATCVLEDDGFNVKLIDAPAVGTRLDEVLQIVKEFKPSLVVLDTSTASIRSDMGVASAIKKCLPECRSILVGTHVSACPEDTLSLGEGVDMVARREYEYTVIDVARALRDGREPYGALGISHKVDGKVKHNPDRPLAENLDEIPFVSRSYKRHLKIENYFYAHSQHPIVSTISGRGCPYRCIFCVYPQTFSSRRYRTRSIGNIVDELEYILKEFPQVREIMFEDDTLTASKRRCRKMSEEILRRGLKFRWSANSRCDVDYETLRLMKKAGCRLLSVGIESGDQPILDGIHKHITVEKIRRFMADIKRAGILAHGCFMVGNPGDSKETLERTLQFAKELNPDTAQFFPIMVYPGTEAYEWAKANGYLSARDFSEWVTKDGLHNCVVDFPSLSSTEMVDFCDRARREFYMRPSYIAGKLVQAVRSPGERRRILRSGKRLAKYLLRGTFGRRRSRTEKC